MKFFKHFTDAHSGKSMQLLRKKFGLRGIGFYWVLVEICAAKMDKDSEEQFTAEHCNFHFEKTYLMRSLGSPSLKHLSIYLRSLDELCLISYSEVDDLYAISMPKLLECLDRDSNRARKERDESAPKIKKKIKKEDKEYKENGFDIEVAFADYPIRIKGPDAITRFVEQIKSAIDFEDLKISITHYNKFLALPTNEYRSPKQSWETFLGVKKKPFWRDFVSADCLIQPGAPKLGGLSKTWEGHSDGV